MADISRVALFGKLNPVGYRAIEAATVSCKLRGNPYVELVHWIHQILTLTDSDVHRILKHFRADPAALAGDMTATLDRLPRGSTSISDLSSHLEEATERGWVYATLLFGEGQVRTGHIVVGMLKTPSLRNALKAISKEFDKIKIDELTDCVPRHHRGLSRRGDGRERRPRNGRRSDAGRGQRRSGPRGDGQAGGAEALFRRPHREGEEGRRWTRSSAATRRSARSSTS